MTARDAGSARNALIFVWIPAHFREMMRVAELLKASPGHTPIVLIMAKYTGYERDVRRCASQGIRVLTPDDFWNTLHPAARVPAPWEVDTVRIPARWTLKWARAVAYDLSLRAVRLVTGSLLWIATAVFHGVRALLWQIARFFLLMPIPAPVAKAFGELMAPLRPGLRSTLLRAFGFVYETVPALLPAEIVVQRDVVRGLARFLEQHQVALLVLPEDNFYYSTNVWIRRMHERGGAAVIVPFTIANMLEWSESFYNSPAHDGARLLNRVVGAAFPRWVHTHKGKRLVMPPEHVVSNECLGMSPPIPWLINSGHADAIAVESEFMAQYYARAGIAPDQIRVTGSLADDVVYAVSRAADVRREALYTELGLPRARPMILCALPPDQLAGHGRPGCEFADYRELLRAFAEPLEALIPDYNVVVSLHPRITAEQASVLDGMNVKVSGRNIAELVPLAKIYVACCSATIRLAVACGIPVINYDAYCYDYEDFMGIPGVIAVKDKDGYVRKLDQLARDPDEYERIRRAQNGFAAREMMIDGKAGERMLRLFDELIDRRLAMARAA